MGANDKVAATFHGGDYTPSERYPGTERVRERYLRYPDGDTRTVRGLLFDRWLDDIRAEAKREALEELANAFQYKAWSELIKGSLKDRLRVAQPITEWLRARANQFKLGSE